MRLEIGTIDGAELNHASRVPPIGPYVMSNHGEKSNCRISVFKLVDETPDSTTPAHLNFGQALIYDKVVYPPNRPATIRDRNHL